MDAPRDFFAQWQQLIGGEMVSRSLRLWMACLWIGLVSVAALTAQDGEVDFCEAIAPPADAELSYYIGLAGGYSTQGNYTTAIEIYGCALEVDANFVPAYLQRGLAYFIQGDDASALADFNRALELDEASAEGYNRRGMLYTRQGRFGLALTDFDLALALDPVYAAAYNNRAAVHAIEGNYDLALVDVQLAIDLAPDFPTPYATLGMIYSALAVEQYAQFQTLAGENSRLPAGDADIVLNALAESRFTGTFNIWLPLLTAANP